MAHGNEIENTAAAVEQLAADFADLTLDCLHSMAKSAADSATRRAAQRVIDERTRMVALANEPKEATTAYRVTLKTSMYGTPQPTAEALVSGRSDRHARAAGLELAADVERSLATTREKWLVTVGSPLSERDCIRVDVALSLMTADPAEARRALAVLEGVTGKRARRRGARVDGSDESSATGDESGASSSASSSGSSGATGDDPHGGRIRRRRRQQFRELAGKDATAFEAKMLSRDRAALPDFVQAVVDGGERTEAFWMWLAEEFRAQKIDGGAK